MVKIETIELQGMFLHHLENDVFLVDMKPLILTLEMGKELIENILQLNDGKKAWVIIEVAGVKRTTRESNIYMKNNSHIAINGAALILKTDLARMVVGFFMRLSVPSYPIKTFTNLKDAEEWINKLRNNGQ